MAPLWMAKNGAFQYRHTDSYDAVPRGHLVGRFGKKQELYAILAVFLSRLRKDDRYQHDAAPADQHFFDSGARILKLLHASSKRTNQIGSRYCSRSG